MTVGLNPRYVPVAGAWIEIAAGMDNILRALNLGWYDALYYVARTKLQLLREMGASIASELPPEGIPDAEHIIGSAFYMPMIKYDLTQAELYSLISRWESREATGMIKDERGEL